MQCTRSTSERRIPRIPRRATQLPRTGLDAQGNPVAACWEKVREWGNDDQTANTFFDSVLTGEHCESNCTRPGVKPWRTEGWCGIV
eukprot:69591-Prymnesium_polylepis.2